MILYRFQMLKIRMGRILGHPHYRGAALDGHKQVVKVMGDTTCKGSYGLHLLGLLELGFKFFL